MRLIMTGAPVPSDYFGVLWALAGIKNALILEHGATGTAFYNAVSFSVMNKQSPKGILFTTGLDEDDVVMGREKKSSGRSRIWMRNIILRSFPSQPPP